MGFNTADGTLGSDVAMYDPSSGGIIAPDVSGVDLGGFMPGGFTYSPQSPGGGMSADPFGITAISGNPAVNPNKTGDWMTTAQLLLNSANKAFTTYVSGSPSVAIPPAKKPTGLFSTGTTVGTTTGVNWPVVGGAVAVGVVALFLLAKYA